MKYDKLVRDKIPEILSEAGLKATFRVLNVEEYKEYLEKKLDEEVAEFHKSKDVEELADIAEVVMALAFTLGVETKLLDIKTEKYQRSGAFKNRICLLEIEDKESGDVNIQNHQREGSD